jgi:hypothetical protein
MTRAGRMRNKPATGTQNCGMKKKKKKKKKASLVCGTCGK